jgi:hypothetical protein
MRLPRMTRKVQQQGIFAGKQRYGTSTPLDPALQQVDHQVSSNQPWFLPLCQTNNPCGCFHFVHPRAHHVLNTAVQGMRAGERIIRPLP